MFYKGLRLVIISGLLIVQAEKVQGTDSVVLNSSTLNACEFTIETTSLTLDTIQINDKLYIRPYYTGSVLLGEPFDPAVPGSNVIIGLPPSGTYHISVIPGEVKEYTNARISPISKWEGKGEDFKEIIEEGSVYQSTEPYPQSLYEDKGASFFGDQRIVEIYVQPVQFFPNENKFIVYKNITIRVTFTGGISGTVSYLKSEDRYRAVILNYDIARQWRVHRKAGLSKLVSPNASGMMYKIPITNTGVYTITGKWLSDQGVDLSEIDVSTIKMYNNGGRELSRNLGDSKFDGLQEIAIYVVDGGDGSFDSADYLLFYGISVNDWEYTSSDQAFHHYFNIYTTQNSYWLAFNDNVPGKRMETVPFQTIQGATVVSSFKDHQFIEQDLVNPYGMNRYWAGEAISTSNPVKTVTFETPDVVAGGETHLRWQIAYTYSSFSFNVNTVHLSLNNTTPDSYKTSVNLVGTIWGTFTNVLASGNNQASITFSGINNVTTQIWLDWVELDYLRSLKLNSSALRFFSPDSSGSYVYPLEGAVQSSLCFDVTDALDAKQMVLGNVMGKYGFYDSQASTPKVYAAISPDAALTPGSLEQAAFKNLRDPALGADFIIITHEDFYDEAVRLQEHKNQFDSLKTKVVKIQDIYDNFSGGLMDPVAIRDFIAATDSIWQPAPSYVLLFGDGDFDYKNILAQNDKNWIPTFNDCFSDKISKGENVTDDYFVMIKGDGSGSGNDRKIDLAIGRLPVRSAAEAKIVADKIIQYESDPDLNDWKMRVLMVADDDIKKGTTPTYELRHTRKSEVISNVFPASARIERLYLIEYELQTVGSFLVKPKAQDDLIEYINNGALIINYIGHSSEEVWADERVFEQVSDLPRLDNQGMLPLIFSASCTFGLYDHYAKQSFSEDLVVAEGKGAIAVISASRETGPDANEPLDEQFMENLFQNEKPSTRIGDALTAAKLTYFSMAFSNNSLYQLFGDPTLRLTFPRYEAVITSVEPDTFKALSVVRVKGEVQRDDATDTDFSGTIALQAFDAIKEKVYRQVDDSGELLGTWKYKNPGNLLFRGEAKIENGQFEVPFIVPKDISYNTLTGRINGYFWNNETDGAANQDDIPIGGSAVSTDQEGPTIRIFFDGQESFITGDIVPRNPVFIGEVEDLESGVNITGEIGHKIILTIDDSSGTDITEQFQYNEGSYQKGQVKVSLEDIAAGDHYATFKVWDNANNSSSQTIEFQVVPNEALHFDRVMNWPNPLSKETYFTFVLNQEAEVSIKIFTVSGRMIQKLDGLYAEAGFNTFKWDGRDWAGDLLANGVYLYKIEAKAYNGEKHIKSDVIERLMVLHE